MLQAIIIVNQAESSIRNGSRRTVSALLWEIDIEAIEDIRCRDRTERDRDKIAVAKQKTLMQ